MKIGRSEGLRKGWPMECMHDLRPDPEVSPPEIPPKLTPGRLFDKLWSATTGNPKVWSEFRVLQPTPKAKGKHHNDQRVPKAILPAKVRLMTQPTSRMEGEQT